MGLGILMLLVGIGVAGQKGFAREDVVYLSDEGLRNSIIEQLETPVENQLPTIQQMAELTSLSGAWNGSIEGVQYAVNATSMQVSGNGIIDFRAIAGMKSLKNYYAYSSLIQGSEEKVLDISPFGELSNLETLYFGYANIQDFSRLSELSHLKSIEAYGGYNVKLPTVYVDKATGKFIMEHPVKYSKQFDGERTVEGYTDKSDVTIRPVIEGQAVVIDNLKEEVSTVYLTFEASSKEPNSAFFASFSCEVPVVWY
jgi:hypothetical protein